MAPLGLDGLPTEIKQRIIIIIGSYETAMNLRQVNRSWKRVASEPFVYKAIMKNRSEAGWSTIPLSRNAPWFSWVRYALADSRAAKLATLTDEYEKTRTVTLDTMSPPSLALSSFFNEKTYNWIPQLMASQRKSALSSLKSR